MMEKIWFIPLLALGLLGATAETADARERGMSTFSGQRASIDYSAAIRVRTVGDRCRVTMCDRPASSEELSPSSDPQSTVELVGNRSSVRSRLGAASCNSTFCGRR